MIWAQATNLSGAAPGSPLPPRAAGDPGPPLGAALATRILIVEDEAMIAWMFESQLEDMGFADIEIVSSGRQAIDAAAARAPGLIVSDINLGDGLDGVAAMAAIRASTPAAILFVTGYANAETLGRIDRELPGARVLRKPVQLADLRSAVLAALGGQKGRH